MGEGGDDADYDNVDADNGDDHASHDDIDVGGEKRKSDDAGHADNPHVLDDDAPNDDADHEGRCADLHAVPDFTPRASKTGTPRESPRPSAGGRYSTA